MNENSQQPQEYDAVLSTQNTPSDALVLGGLAGVKKRLSDKDRKIRIAALSDAVKYGNKGIKLVLKALKDPSPDIYWQAYSLLKLLPEAKIQEIIRKRNPYLFFQCLDLFEGHSETVWLVAIASNGQKLVSMGSDKSINIWDINTGDLLHTIEKYKGYGFYDCVAISSDGQQLVYGNSSAYTIAVWDLNRIKLLSKHNLERKDNASELSGFSISPDGQKLVSQAGTAIAIWELDTGKLFNTFKNNSIWIRSFAFSANGEKLVAGGIDKTIQIWEFSSGKLLNTLKGHLHYINSVAVTPDSKKIISGSWDKTIRIWDINTGELLKTFEDNSLWIQSIAVTQDGDTLIAGGTNENRQGIIKIWDLNTGKFIKTLPQHSIDITSVAITPDGKKIISGGYKTIQIWGLPSTQLQQ